MSWESFYDNFTGFSVLWFVSFICFVLACLLYLLCEKVLFEGPLVLHILAYPLMYIVYILLFLGLPYLGMYEFIMWSREKITNEIIEEEVEKAIKKEREYTTHEISQKHKKEIGKLESEILILESKMNRKQYWSEIAYVIDKVLHSKIEHRLDKAFDAARNKILDIKCNESTDIDNKDYIEISSKLFEIYYEVLKSRTYEKTVGMDSSFLGHKIVDYDDYFNYAKLLTVYRYLKEHDTSHFLQNDEEDVSFTEALDQAWQRGFELGYEEGVEHPGDFMDRYW